MPEQPEIHFLWYYGFALALILFAGIVGTIQERQRRKENRFRPTHRRTYPRF